MRTLTQLIDRPKQCRNLSNPKTIRRISEKRWQKSNVPREPQSALGSPSRNMPNLTAANSMGAVTTRFRVWLQDPQIPPVWTGVEIVDWPEDVGAGWLEVTVVGDGYNLKRLMAERQDLFSAYL